MDTNAWTLQNRHTENNDEKISLFNFSSRLCIKCAFAVQEPNSTELVNKFIQNKILHA